MVAIVGRSRSKAKGRAEYGRYFSVPHSVVCTEAFRSLSANSHKLWLNLMVQYNGYNNGKIAAVYSQLKEYGWAEKSLSRSLIELQEKGFIKKTRQGGFGLGGKYCTYYRFTHLPTAEIPLIGLRGGPPTSDFRRWTPEKKASSQTDQG